MPQTAKKALKLTTEIDIHAVSCPGVWLPGRGRCSLSVCLLGFHTRTNKLPPVFPLLYHEKFKFERTFVGVRNLSVLERVLEAETVYLELVQEEPAGEAVLAVFESSVRDLLFPKPAERLSYSGVDLDLLMEPTRDFPGIISPKIEVSTRTSVSETRAPLHQCSQDNVSFGHAHNKNTKAVYRCGSPEEGRKGEVNTTNADGVSGAIEEAQPSHGSQPVHNSPRREEYGRGGAREEATKPRFVYRRPDDDLLSRIPTSPTRNTRYLGIPSRYLSRSTGNLSDLPRTSIPSRYGGQRSGGGGRTSSETDGGAGRRYTHPRRRPKDDLAHRAHVTLLDPERCPHCEGEHGAESCTTCRTYHRYFPPPPRPHAHTHSYHTNNPHAALKVLRQPAHRQLRPRKRYLAEIDGIVYGDRGRPPRLARSVSPQHRPASASPDREADLPSAPYPNKTADLPSSRLRKDEDDLSAEEDNDSKSHSRSHSNSRSPSPPASHASAPAALSRQRNKLYRRPLTPSARRRHYDSDDDTCDDFYIPRRYDRYLRRLGCVCWCALCSRHSHCRTCRLLSRPIYTCQRYRSSYLPYYPYHSYHHRPYASTYLHNLEMIDSDDLNLSSPQKPTKTTSKVDKNEGDTSEDSDLFDSSQVEEIEEGINKKSRLTKRENWLETKKHTKDSSKSDKNVTGESGVPSPAHVSGGNENEPNKTNTSSAEFFDIE